MHADFNGQPFAMNLVISVMFSLAIRTGSVTNQAYMYCNFENLHIMQFTMQTFPECERFQD